MLYVKVLIKQWKKTVSCLLFSKKNMKSITANLYSFLLFGKLARYVLFGIMSVFHVREVRVCWKYCFENK